MVADQWSMGMAEGGVWGDLRRTRGLWSELGADRWRVERTGGGPVVYGASWEEGGGLDPVVYGTDRWFMVRAYFNTLTAVLIEPAVRKIALSQQSLSTVITNLIILPRSTRLMSFSSVFNSTECKK